MINHISLIDEIISDVTDNDWLIFIINPLII